MKNKGMSIALIAMVAVGLLAFSSASASAAPNRPQFTDDRKDGYCQPHYALIWWDWSEYDLNGNWLVCEYVG